MPEMEYVMWFSRQNFRARRFIAEFDLSLARFRIERDYEMVKARG